RALNWLYCLQAVNPERRNETSFPRRPGGFHGDGCLVQPDASTFFNFEYECVSFKLGDMSVHATYGHHIISFLYFLSKLSLILGFLLLWPDHKKVEYQDDPAKEK